MIEIKEWMQAYVASYERLIAVCFTKEKAMSFWGTKCFPVGTLWFVVVCIT